MKTREQRAAAREILLREGELYRLYTLRSRYEVQHALQPQALVQSAAGKLLGKLQSRLGGLLGGGGKPRLKTVLPLALTLGSWIGRRRLWKPALALGALAAAGAVWLLRRSPAE